MLESTVELLEELLSSALILLVNHWAAYLFASPNQSESARIDDITLNIEFQFWNKSCLMLVITNRVHNL